MSLLFNLPEVLYNTICSEWISIKEFGVVDSAVCHTGLREVFLQQWSSKSMVLSLPSDLYYVDILNWFYARKVKLTKVWLDRKIFSRRRLLCQVDPTCITEIVIPCDDTKTYVQGFMDVVNASHNLVSLDCSCFFSSFMLSMLSTPTLSNLTALMLRFIGHKAINGHQLLPLLNKIGSVCSKLKQFELDCLFVPEYDKAGLIEQICLIEQNNADLEILTVPASIEVLDFVLLHSRNIKHLRFGPMLLKDTCENIVGPYLVSKMLELHSSTMISVRLDYDHESYLEISYSSTGGIERILFHKYGCFCYFDMTLFNKLPGIKELESGYGLGNLVVHSIVCHSQLTLLRINIAYSDHAERVLVLFSAVLSCPNLMF